MTRTNLLDYGYLELVDCWGSDERIVEAAISRGLTDV